MRQLKVLVTYSSGFGATREVAEKIGDVLGKEGDLKVTVRSIDEVGDIAPYEAVIVGSSVRAEKPLANVRDFFAGNREVLAGKKVALFAVCLTAGNHEGREKVRKEYLGYIVERYPELNLLTSEAFGGKIDFERLNPIMKLLMTRVLERSGLPAQGSIDTRDWGFIEAWAAELKQKLLNN